MKNQDACNREIIVISMYIQRVYPELSKYLDEMTLTLADARSAEISGASLQEYNKALHAIVLTYANTHHESARIRPRE